MSGFLHAPLDTRHPTLDTPTVSYREKQLFFQQLAHLLRSGVPLPLAAAKLARGSSSQTRKTSRRLQRLLEDGLTASDAFEALHPQLGTLERSTLSALARTGRLDVGLQRLADYFGVLARARGEIIRQSLYPLFILHLGVLLLNLQVALGPGGVGAYVRATASVLLVLYAFAGLLAFIIPVILEMGVRSSFVDTLLRWLPLFGKARRSLATSRFCGTLDLQLDAGVNVIESLQSAADASRSGLIHSMARRAIPGLRAGDSLGLLLSLQRGALPGEVVDAILLSEETGDLHRTLPLQQKEFELDGLQRLKTAAEWLPKLLYLGILAYLGWKIVSFYKGYYGEVQSLIDSI